MQYLACDPSNIQSDGTCSVPVWVDQPSVLPPLTTDDAAQIWTAIALLWCLGFGIRTIRRLLGF